MFSRQPDNPVQCQTEVWKYHFCPGSTWYLGCVELCGAGMVMFSLSLFTARRLLLGTSLGLSKLGWVKRHPPPQHLTTARLTFSLVGVWPVMLALHTAEWEVWFVTGYLCDKRLCFSLKMTPAKSKRRLKCDWELNVVMFWEEPGLN